MADFFETYLPVILSILAIAVFGAISYFVRQNQTTVGGTIRLESVQTDLTGLKEDIKNEFKDVKDFIEIKDRENKEEFRRIATRVESLEREGYNIRWRLEQIEKRNGGGRSAV